MSNQENIKYRISKLKDFREDYIDDIPDRLVHSVWKYKCTNGWFGVWWSRFHILEREGLLPSELYNRFLDFCKEYKKRQEHDSKTEEGFYIRREDIDTGNRLISKAINHLEKELKVKSQPNSLTILH